MSQRDLEPAFELIDGNAALADFAGPRDEALVRSAESALGLPLPPTYRQFVLRHGAGSFDGVELYGVTTADFTSSSVPNGIWLTLSQRLTGLPSNLLVVADTGDGDWYCLDCAASGEAPVIVYLPGAKAQPRELVAEDFGAFLLDQLQSVLP